MGSHVTCQLSVTRITPLPQGEGLFHNYPPLKDSLHSVESIFPSNTNYIQTKRAKLDSRHVFCKLAKKMSNRPGTLGCLCPNFHWKGSCYLKRHTHTNIKIKDGIHCSPVSFASPHGGHVSAVQKQNEVSFSHHLKGRFLWLHS